MQIQVKPRFYDYNRFCSYGVFLNIVIRIMFYFDIQIPTMKDNDCMNQ